MDRYLPGEGSVLAALALLPLLVLGWWLWRLARQRAQRHRHVDAVLQRRQPVGPTPRSRTACARASGCSAKASACGHGWPRPPGSRWWRRKI
jgi:hypothetical protein